jgi:hypothetical protein
MKDKMICDISRKATTTVEALLKTAMPELSKLKQSKLRQPKKIGMLDAFGSNRFDGRDMDILGDAKDHSALLPSMEMHNVDRDVIALRVCFHCTHEI